MKKLFGTNGVRGIFPTDLDLEMVHDLAASFATYLQKGPVLVGYDGRISSPIIARTVCATLNACGIDCKNAGLVPTPCLEYATKKLKYAGGIMVTASHNPPQYNGIKICAVDGVEISREDEKIIEDIYFDESWSKYQTSLGDTSDETDAVRTYLENITALINSEQIKSRKFTIVLDLGNGAQSVTAPDFCKDLHCNVITINEDIDGNFPGRGSEPTPQNLCDLSDAVIKNNADLGIAFDGDGDRSIFCDNEGNILSGERSALLLARHILLTNANSKIVTCLNSGAAIEGIAQKFDSTVIRTKVGSVEVSRRMVEENAILGFEENGGFMFGKHNHVRDGVMTLGLMFDLLASSNQSITDLVASLPDSFTTKDRICCTAEQAKSLIVQLSEEFAGADVTDGIKITLGTRQWVMIRPSGTEPIVRVYAEAPSQAELEQLIAQYVQKIKTLVANNTFKTNRVQS